MNLGSRIKILRRQLDLTQTKFGERIGMKQNSIALIESGSRNISSQAMLAICREFNVNESWLRDGVGEMFAPGSNDEIDALAKKYDLSAGERIFLEKYLCLKKEQRDAVMSFMMEVYREITDADQSPAAVDLKELSIDEKVELYRAELEREEKAREKSEA